MERTAPGSDRPRVGISRCLLGDDVRYDGGHKRADALLAALGRDVEWVPVCPEVEVGMGTPREPIHLVAAGSAGSAGARVRLVGVSSQRDWTSAVNEWSRGRVRELAGLGLSGFVLKADSPSCGPEGVPVEHGETGRGLFAQALLDAMPAVPVEDEVRLLDERVRRVFLDRVFAHHRARRLEHHP